MARDEAKVRVRLDTRAAKADLEGLAKEGEASATRVGRALGRGPIVTGALAGAGFAAGMGLARRAADAGGLGEIIGEQFVGFNAAVGELLGTPEARAGKQARDEVKQAFAEIAGRTGSVPPEARAYYDQIRELRLATERGNQKIDQELGGNIVRDATSSIIEAIKNGFQGITNLLGGHGTGR